MSVRDRVPSFPRRSFLSRIGAGVTIAGGALGLDAASAAAQSSAAEASHAPHHAQDDWLDGLPRKHRLVFDTTTPDGFGAALLYASNYFTGNKTGYGLSDTDIGVVIVARHRSTALAYNDAIWSKYGAVLGPETNLIDPGTKQAAATNLYSSSSTGRSLPNLGVTMDAVLKLGVHFAVCQMATRRLAGSVAKANGGDVESAFKELAANLVTNGHLVPAGIVAVSRAQERGYTFAHAV